MTRRILLLAISGLLTLAGVTPAPAQRQSTARELLEALPAQIRAEADAREKASPSPNGSGRNAEQLVSTVHSAQSSLEAGNEAAAVQQLQQAEFIGASKPVRDTCETIIHKIREEREAQQAAATAAVASLLKRAGQTIVAARTPPDLDAIIQELAHASDDPNLTKTFDNRSDYYNRRLQAATSFAIRWQDCLAGPNRADGRSAVDNFRSFLTDNSGALQSMEIPRSTILAHLPAAPSRSEETPTPAPVRSPVEINASAAAVLDKLHTLDDLPAAIRGLTALRDEMQTSNRGYGSRANEVSTLLQHLHELEDAYAEFQSGLDRSPEAWWTSRYNNGSNDTADENLLVPLRAQLLALTLPRLLSAPDTEKPAPGERVDAFLTRLIDTARKRSDWPTVARGLEYRRMLLNPRSPYEGGNPSGTGRDDATAFKEFLAGQNFEQASQYEQAVAAYLAALDTGTQEIPVALISERLAAIKKAHPKEYDGGARTSFPTGAVEYENAVRAAYRAQARAAEADASSGPAAAGKPGPSASPLPTPSVSPSPSPKAAPSATPSASP